MQEYQQRVVEEKIEVDAKMVKLNTFLNTSGFFNMDQAEQVRMERQLLIMKLYSQVLGERIEAF